jgi:hypothetical protein
MRNECPMTSENPAGKVCAGMRKDGRPCWPNCTKPEAPPAGCWTAPEVDADFPARTRPTTSVASHTN